MSINPTDKQFGEEHAKEFGSNLDPELQKEIKDFESGISTDTYHDDGEEASKHRRIFAHNKAQNRGENEGVVDGDAADNADNGASSEVDKAAKDAFEAESNE